MFNIYHCTISNDMASRSPIVAAFDLHQILLMSSKVPPLTLPLRIAMIGSGAISRHHFPAFRDRPDVIRLSAICEKNPQAAAAFAAQFPYPVPIFGELDALLKKAQVDAALVALPHNLHFPVASQLVAEGIPVLVEKPLTCSLEEARAPKKLSGETRVPVVLTATSD
jgi:predicted dehydrogenase